MTLSSDCPVQPTLHADTIHDFQASLTVIRGQAQLIQRRMQRSTSADAEQVLARLDVIDRVATQLSVELEKLRQPE